jgi:chromosome segregation ATPase
LTNTKTRLEGEFSAAEAGMRSAIEALTCRNKELESRAGDLIQTKYKLDSNLSEITSRLNTTDAELKAAKAELENLRADKNYLEKVSKDARTFFSYMHVTIILEFMGQS